MPAANVARQKDIFAYFGVCFGYQKERKGPTQDRPQETSQSGQNSPSQVSVAGFVVACEAAFDWF
jgi:hypothetical protein